MTAQKNTASLSIVLLTSLATLAGCSALSLQGAGLATSSSDMPRGSEAGIAPTEDSSHAAPSDTDSSLFRGISEDDNTQLARDFKVLLRTGEIARLFEKNELFSKVESICGPKIWDQCLVAYESEPNELSWKRWSFKAKNDDRVYVYPEMFYDLAEPKWAEKTIERLTNSGDAKLFISMVTDKCGQPLDSGCEVRAFGANQGTFRLKVRTSGEVIEVMSTLRDWKEDL